MIRLSMSGERFEVALKGQAVHWNSDNERTNVALTGKLQARCKATGECFKTEIQINGGRVDWTDPWEESLWWLDKIIAKALGQSSVNLKSLNLNSFKPKRLFDLVALMAIAKSQASYAQSY